MRDTHPHPVGAMDQDSPKQAMTAAEKAARRAKNAANRAKRAAKAIDALPLDAIVLETDCPYMAPEPVRGTRCDSSLIRYVGEYIAQLRGISAEEVFRTTAENARWVYGL